MHRPWLHRGCRIETRRQILALGELEFRRANEREQGGRDIHERDGFFTNDSGPRTGWRREDQWHPDGLLVDEQAVLCFAVFPQALTVITCDRNNGLVTQAHLFESSDEASDLRVRERNLPEVGVRGVLRPKRLGGCVRRMWIEQMYPQEERAVAILLQPLDRTVDDVLVIDNGRAQRWPGGYAQWLQDRRTHATRGSVATSTSAPPTSPPAKEKKKTHEGGRSHSTIRHDLKKAEKEMAKLQRQRDALDGQLAEAGTDHVKLAEVGAGIAGSDAAIAAIEERWLELSEEAEAR